ncbi:MAG: hypothetical protein CV087_23850 [Candidatus Brocadia sp. WS118]|nr:MAG: hypothetical protein CV087_23850 [Candidatus Brocadia sp. WS118]
MKKKTRDFWKDFFRSEVLFLFNALFVGACYFFIATDRHGWAIGSIASYITILMSMIGHLIDES